MVLKWSRVIFRKSKIYKHSILPPRGSKKAFPVIKVLKTNPSIALIYLNFRKMVQPLPYFLAMCIASKAMDLNELLQGTLTSTYFLSMCIASKAIDFKSPTIEASPSP